jgi:hypothetical protein
MRTTRWTLLGLGLLMAGSAFAAGICEPLREQIEFQIAGTGATGFAVIVVDANAQVAGKVVGTCARGARKLVYVRASDRPATVRPARSAPATVAARETDEDIITECRDGTEVRGNASCKP